MVFYVWVCCLWEICPTYRVWRGSQPVGRLAAMQNHCFFRISRKEDNSLICWAVALQSLGSHFIGSRNSQLARRFWAFVEHLRSVTGGDVGRGKYCPTALRRVTLNRAFVWFILLKKKYLLIVFAAQTIITRQPRNNLVLFFLFLLNFSVLCSKCWSCFYFRIIKVFSS